MTNQAALSISELLMFNSVKRVRKKTVYVCHSSDRETPVPIYIGLHVHAQTRKKSVIDSLHDIGVSVSYDRVLSISGGLANGVATQFENDNAVCPTSLRKGLFTTAGFDNIDHNPSSTTAKDSFHGTAMSLTQHPTKTNQGTVRESVPYDSGNSTTASYCTSS